MSTAAPATASPYQARDVVNAPAIKARIAARSTQRGDAPDITAWLANHLVRHVIGNLQADAPAVQPIADATALQRLCGSAEPPAWALQRLCAAEAGAPVPALWWVDPDCSAVLTLETRLVEFLSTRRGTSLEGKLQRVNCPQALARWTLEHLAFAKKQHSGWVDTTPSAVQGLLRGQLGTFVELDAHSPQLRQEMAYESQMMGHCVGQFSDRQRLRGGYGEHYAAACEQGRLRLFSYRTGSAQPRITVSALVGSDGRLQIDQIKGKQNRPPIARYVPDVVALLNHLPLNDVVPPDALAMGIVRRPSHVQSPTTSPWCAVADLHTEAEQLWLLQHHPAQLPALRLHTPFLQWMVAARKDTLDAAVLERMPQTAALQHTLALARKRPVRTRGTP